MRKFSQEGKMKKELLHEIVENFFTCSSADILQIFNEMLNTITAQEQIPATEAMSRNYETAQSNPEIHYIPGNLKDARDAIFPYFWGTDNWSSKLHLENVKGPANYASLIGSLACLLKNPNLCVDTYSQRSNELELKAITSLANLVFYHTENPWGVFTMGGTISNLYGGKIGIEKVHPGAMKKGLSGTRLAGIVSEAAHYSNETLAGWLGIGTDNLHSIPVDSSCSMDMSLFEKKIDELYSEKTVIAFVIATFGSTDAFGIDNIGEIRKIISDKSKQYSMPLPHLHVDAAAGWSLCFLNEYSIEKNEFELSSDAIETVKKIKKYSMAMQHADSVTIDFHKMGWGHYPASAFIVYNRDDLKYLLRSMDQVPYFSEADYRHDPALFTLETSRPGIGPYSVMASLNGIGLKGYQLLVAHSLEMAAILKKKLSRLENCHVINMDSLGPGVVWWVLPAGRNAEEIYRKMINGELKESEYKRYFSEIHRLFEKRKSGANPEKDALLSYTTSMGYNPGGISLPAWKAVFFNPKTDEAVIDQIIKSIEEL
jgi:glutamate/tyrosine decarboxylase-like PLP-dependent enzyme